MRSGGVGRDSSGGCEAGGVHEVCSNEAVLLLDGREVVGRACERIIRVVVVVTPLSLYRLATVRWELKGYISYEVVSKLEPGDVCV